MADWRQIQARIRKAKASPESAAKLTELYEKTRDGMVAYELARLAEKSGSSEEAVRWYVLAAERFRRADWKKKAEAALVRLGAPVSVAASQEPPTQSASPEPTAQQSFFSEAPAIPAEPTFTEPLPANTRVETVPPATAATPVEGKRTRRGRRGGRRHRKHRQATRVAPAAAPTEPTVARASAESVPEPPPVSRPAPERPQASSGWQGHGRAGEPALASRLAHLEAILRRLLASPLYLLDDAEQAPAGPGVYLLSDSDLTTSYFVESCKTLRIALGQLARGRAQRSDRNEASLRARMAEHLGITEARVSKYLKDHCVVRWIQLDEDAHHLAHFAIAVLRPALNQAE